MEKVNTNELVKEVAKRMGCYKKDVEELFKHFSDIIVENVQIGRAVSHKDIGIFYPYQTMGSSRPCQVKLKFRPTKKIAIRVDSGNSCNNVKEDT